MNECIHLHVCIHLCACISLSLSLHPPPSLYACMHTHTHTPTPTYTHTNCRVVQSLQDTTNCVQRTLAQAHATAQRTWGASTEAAQAWGAAVRGRYADMRERAGTRSRVWSERARHVYQRAKENKETRRYLFRVCFVVAWYLFGVFVVLQCNATPKSSLRLFFCACFWGFGG